MQTRIAHSPDTDDYFFFWPIVAGRVDSSEFDLRFEAFDTERLNQLALSADYDVIAISAANYPRVSNRYLVLEHGASVGRGYGPKIISSAEISLEALNHATIGIPGEFTTAAAITRMIAPRATTVSIPILPYEQVFDALRAGKVDAAVVIHEAQLTFGQHGFKEIVDIGRWWQEQTGLVLPLGINVIRRDLGQEAISSLCALIKASIEYSLGHKAEVISSLIEHAAKRSEDLDSEALLERYLSMYANHDSLFLDEDSKVALCELSRRIDPTIAVEFARST